jgi:uncharacterized protein DUF481
LRHQRTTSIHSGRALAIACLAGGVLLAGSPADAQAPGWHSLAEANASLLFGATSQTLTSFAGTLAHNSSRFSADAGFKFRYGESEDAERVKFVNARGWEATTSVDVLPKQRFSPFFFASSEASLEKRIQNRSAGGAGAKWVFAQTNTGNASISLALLGERTRSLADSAPTTTGVARYSWRVKVGQKVADRVSLSHVTFYAPVVDAPGRYTITSTSVGAFALNRVMALTLTFNDNFDSEARARGAPSNNDGSLLFGIRGTW